VNTTRRPPDFWLLLIVGTLLMLGLTMVFSSSSVTAAGLKDFHYNAYYFVQRQALWSVIALGAMWWTMRLDLEVFRSHALTLVGLSVLSLVLVLIPHVGVVVNGARRWIAVGPLSFQPSEFAKFAMVFYLADVLARRGDKIKDYKALIPLMIIFLVIFALINREPDLGTALVVAAAFLVLLFIGGAKFMHCLFLLSSAPIGVMGIIITQPYRLDRMASFWNPFKFAETSGYHMVQSLLALGSGGVWGLGLGESRQKFFYLPEQHTDFIFAVLGEELGLVGTLSVLSLFMLFMVRAFYIARRSRDTYQALLAAGLAFTISFQGFLNMGVVSNSVPLTGVPLPLISYGGTSLVITLAAVGLIVNVSTRRRERREESMELTPTPSELESLAQRFQDSGLGLVTMQPPRRRGLEGRDGRDRRRRPR
jgi:cell division protein FtsW